MHVVRRPGTTALVDHRASRARVRDHKDPEPQIRRVTHGRFHVAVDGGAANDERRASPFGQITFELRPRKSAGGPPGQERCPDVADGYRVFRRGTAVQTVGAPGRPQCRQSGREPNVEQCRDKASVIGLAACIGQGRSGLVVVNDQQGGVTRESHAASRQRGSSTQ